MCVILGEDTAVVFNKAEKSETLVIRPLYLLFHTTTVQSIQSKVNSFLKIKTTKTNFSQLSFTLNLR